MGREETEEPGRTRNQKTRSPKQEKACRQCTNKCFRVHGKKSFSPESPPPAPVAFFKVMIGNFTEILFIPPKFAQTIGDLVEKNIYLEDSYGRRWRVKISLINGAFTLGEGWQDFVVDHAIKVGEFLVFKHISKSIMSVQIFATDACERLHFCGKYQRNSRKRKRSKHGVSPDNLCPNKRHDSSGASEQKSYTTDEDLVNKVTPKRTLCYDLCDTEMVMNCITEFGGEDLILTDGSPLHANHSGKPKIVSTVNNSGAICHVVGEDAIRIQEDGKASASGLSNDEDMGKGIVVKENCLQYIDDFEGHQTTALVQQDCDLKPILDSCKNPTNDYPHCEAQESTLRLSEKPQYFFPEDSAINKELAIIPPNDSFNSDAFKTKCYPHNIENLVVHEEISSENHGKDGASPTTSVVECTEAEIRNQSDTSWAIITYPLAEEMPCAIDVSEQPTVADKDTERTEKIDKSHSIDLPDPEISYVKLDNVNLIGNSFPLSQTSNASCAKNEGENLSVPEEEMDYDVDKDFKEKIGLNRDAPVAVCTDDKDDTMHSAEILAMTRTTASLCDNKCEMPFNASVVDCAFDEQGIAVPSCEHIQSGRKWGNVPSVSRKEDSCFTGAAESTPKSMTLQSGFHEDPDILEGNSGTVLDALLEDNEEKITPCLKEVEVVRTENVDSVGLPSPNYGKFSLFVSTNAQKWLELPEKLPYRMGKLRHDRKVVMLQDPCMRLWPVLYHESIKFIGFTSGWEGFVRANNVQQGDTCDLQLINASEITLQVRFSKP